MATVWVYPEKAYEKLGAERYQCSWEEVRKGAPKGDDFDHDRDIISRYANFPAKQAALDFARKTVDGYKTAYGQVTVTRQVVDWYVEEDRVAEWVDTSDVEYVD